MRYNHEDDEIKFTSPLIRIYISNYRVNLEFSSLFISLKNK